MKLVKQIVSLVLILILSVSNILAETVDLNLKKVSSEIKDNKEMNEQILFLSLTKTAEPLSDLTTNLTVITEEEIKEKNAKNLGEIVDGEAGISYKNYGPLGQNQSIYMRGSTAGQVLVLIDGRPVNDIGTGGGADFNAIPANMIEKVEIIRGSGAAIYGTGAFGGVINVITKKATVLTPNINPYFSYGTFNTINAGITGAWANDTFSILVTPSLLSSDGYRKNSFYDSKNIFAKIAITPTENSEIILSGQVYNADLGNPGSLSWPSQTAKQYEDNNYLKIDYNTKYEDFDIKLSGYNASYDRRSMDITGDIWMDYSNKFATENTGLKGCATYKKMLAIGVEWNKTKYNEKDSLTGNNKIDRNRENTAVYLQGFIDIGNLTLIPVVRADQNTDYDDVSTPALSAIYKVSKEIKVSGNVSKVWNAPTFGQLYGDNGVWYIANPDLKPEKGISSDLGIEYNNGKLGIALTGFYITTDNLIQNVLVDSINYQYQAQNIDQTRQYGYEIEANYKMSKFINHKFNYTYLRAENTKTHTDLTYKPMHNLNYILSVYPIKQLKFTANISYVTSTLCETGDYLKDYCLINVRGDYAINKYISLWAKCDNLTNDDKYQLSYDYPMAGITGTAGIDIKF